MDTLEKRFARASQLREQQTLTAGELREFCQLVNAGGRLPAADGFDESGSPFWRRETVIHWLQTDALQCRTGFRTTATVDPTYVRRGDARPSTWSDADRSVDAVISTEAPVPMVDHRSGELIDEILIASGVEFEEPVPVLRDHRQFEVGEIVGGASNIRTIDGQIIARLRSGSKPIAIETFDDVRDGILRALSVGYRLLEFVIIMPGGSEMVAGRMFTNNSDRPLRVVSRWALDETSFVLRGADQNAKVRSPSFAQGNPPMTAIHSRNSLSRQPSRRRSWPPPTAGHGGIGPPIRATVDSAGRSTAGATV